MDIRPLDISKVQSLIDIAVEEDFGLGDVTTEVTIIGEPTAKASLVAREDMVVCGMPVALEVVKRYHAGLVLEVMAQDGSEVKAGAVIGTISGPLKEMLSAERVVLNFLQRLSGMSTTTSQYVKAVAGTKTQVCDTRKTLPGWRELSKYAVRCGGGVNHRHHLGDGILIKDNHVAQFGEEFKEILLSMIEKARKYESLQFVALEVDDIEIQFARALEVEGIDIVLLDNMSPETMKKAVQMRDASTVGRPLLEASGGITIENIREVAVSGVDRISIGALTHSAVSVDIGLDR